ncbi:MAG: type II secretion system F family protein [Calditrichaeota bacterium]|nr:MAG: type II secretion system F family protein [Calditrichota bacterium]
MPLFTYVAKASPREVRTGEMYAPSEEVLSSRLREMGLYPLEIFSVEEKQDQRFGSLSTIFRKSSRNAVIQFTRQMANLVEAGVTVHAALHLLQEQTTDKHFHKVLTDVVERIKDGYSFSQACAAWPNVFSGFYVNMIKAGEAGGMLDVVLNNLADFLEKEDDVKKQIQTALAYPILMMSMGILTVSVLLTFVVPRIVSMFDQMGQTLPLPTRILIGVSGILSSYGIGILAGLILLGIMFHKYRKHPVYRRNMDRFKLHIPFLKKLIILEEVTQFSRLVSALLTHGVPVHQAFEVGVAASKNILIREELQQTAIAIRQGKKIGRSLMKGKYLPKTFAQMVSIGEDTNQLEIVLSRAASSGDKEVERNVAVFTRLLEPAMIILIGAIIGFIVFAMMLPIFQMDFMVQ